MTSGNLESSDKKTTTREDLPQGPNNMDKDKKEEKLLEVQKIINL